MNVELSVHNACVYDNYSDSLAFSYRNWGCLGSAWRLQKPTGQRANDVSFLRLSLPSSAPHRLGILLCLEADLAGADLVLSFEGLQRCHEDFSCSWVVHAARGELSGSEHV